MRMRPAWYASCGRSAPSSSGQNHARITMPWPDSHRPWYTCFFFSASCRASVHGGMEKERGTYAFADRSVDNDDRPPDVVDAAVGEVADLRAEVSVCRIEVVEGHTASSRRTGLSRWSFAVGTLATPDFLSEEKSIFSDSRLRRGERTGGRGDGACRHCTSARQYICLRQEQRPPSA